MRPPYWAAAAPNAAPAPRPRAPPRSRASTTRAPTAARRCPPGGSPRRPPARAARAAGRTAPPRRAAAAASCAPTTVGGRGGQGGGGGAALRPLRAPMHLLGLGRGPRRAPRSVSLPSLTSTQALDTCAPVLCTSGPCHAAHAPKLRSAGLPARPALTHSAAVPPPPAPLPPQAGPLTARAACATCPRRTRAPGRSAPSWAATRCGGGGGGD